MAVQAGEGVFDQAKFRINFISYVESDYFKAVCNGKKKRLMTAELKEIRSLAKDIEKTARLMGADPELGYISSESEPEIGVVVDKSRDNLQVVGSELSNFITSIKETLTIFYPKIPRARQISYAATLVLKARVPAEKFECWNLDI